MTAVVVLLRGVNVGGHNRVPMATFREVLTALGLRDVRTLLNSGNAVAVARTQDWNALATTIRAALADALQMTVPVVVIPAHTFRTIAAENPIVAPEHAASRLFVSFTQDADALGALSAIAPLVAHDEEFAMGAHATYLFCTHGVRESRAASALMGRIGQATTTRNWATVQKLSALLPSASP